MGVKKRHKKRLSKRVIIFALALLLLGTAFLIIHKPATAELRELQQQEKALNLPASWHRDSTDVGCRKGTLCSRHINIVYNSTALKPQIEHSLAANGWKLHRDSETNFNSQYFDNSQPVHFESWNLYFKPSPQGELCAVVDLEYNASYKKDGPWATVLTLFGKTERCDLHLK